MTADVYEFTAKSLDGKDIELSQYKGDVLLIVNTASQCGFTGQYAGLEQLHKDFAAKGLKVLGFPCNQFGAQEPGGSSEIGAFCQNTKFLVGRDGKVFKRYAPQVEPKDMTKDIEQLLAK